MAGRDSHAEVHPNDDLLLALHDGVLFSGDRPGVEAHLKDCPRCRTRLTALTEDITPAARTQATGSRSTPNPPQASRGAWAFRRTLTGLVLFGIVATAGVLTWRGLGGPADEPVDTGLVDTGLGSRTEPSTAATPTPESDSSPAVADTGSTAPPEAPGAPPTVPEGAASPEAVETPAPAPPSALPSTPAVDALVITSPNRNFRWRVAGSDVERTNDGGGEWRKQSVTLTRPIVAGMAPSAAVCWLVGRGGAVFVAVGATWKDVSFPENVDVVKVAAIDSMNATITMADGREFTTSDQGFSWTQNLR